MALESALIPGVRAFFVRCLCGRSLKNKNKKVCTTKIYQVFLLWS